MHYKKYPLWTTLLVTAAKFLQFSMLATQIPEGRKFQKLF